VLTQELTTESLPDSAKLRRFALTIGVVLFSYSIAGARLESPAHISPLGIPFEITKPLLLSIGLLLASFYASLRYYYYCMVLTMTPMKARSLLRAGQPPHRLTGKYPPGVEANATVERYYPGLRFTTDYTIKFSPHPSEWVGVEIKPISWRKKTKWLVLWEDIDILLPLMVNGVAIITWFLKW
jgi:hypothetical protein